ncbi:replication-associated protein, partial [Porcine circovirus 3]
VRRESPKHRWCFTINNWTPTEWESIVECGGSIARYLIIGKEVGKSGTPHLQGYVNFKNKRRLSSVKRIPGFGRAHLEPARGSHKEASEYCKKEGDYLEIGEDSSSGTRSDLQAAARILTETSGNLTEVAEKMPAVFIRYGRGLRDFCGVMGLGKPRDFKTEVYVFIGPPGCGKTREACADAAARGLQLYFKPRGPWWDGYNGEGAVILDDFYGWVPFDELLRIGDRYPLRVPVKGGFVNFVAKVLYITSNVVPEEWYSSENIRGKLEALFRRFTKVVCWGEGGVKKDMETVYPINY